MMCKPIYTSNQVTLLLFVKIALHILSQKNNPYKNRFYKFIVKLSAALLTLLFTGIFTSFMEIPVQISVLISWEIALLWAFFLLEKWTFSKLKKKNSKIGGLNSIPSCTPKRRTKLPVAILRTTHSTGIISRCRTNECVSSTQHWLRLDY